MNLSKNLTLAECTSSATAIKLKIDNTPTPEALESLKLLAEKVFQPIRDHFGKPIKVSSGYRCPKLNKAIGGSPTSQHMKGEALDLQGTNGVTNKQIYEFVKNNLVFDQLINEYPDKSGTPKWVHVSYKKSGNRKIVLTIR